MNSLRTRLLVQLVGGVLLFGALAGVLLYRNALHEANAFFDMQLQQTALLLRDQPLQFSGTSQAADAAAYDLVVQIWSLDGVRMYLSRPHPVLPGPTTPGLSTVDTGRERWRVFSVRSPFSLIQIAQPMQVRTDRATQLALRTLQPFFWFVPFLAIMVWIAVGRSLAPLRRLARSLSMREGELLKPVPAEHLPEEIKPLAEALNDLLRRLTAALARERDFLADAAHELRTPLAAIRLQMDSLAAAGTESDRNDAIGELAAGVTRATRLAEQLLTIARHERTRGSATGSHEGELLRLDDLAREAVAALIPLSDARGTDLGITDSEPATVRGDRVALQTMISNLVDNAVRYTPRGGRVDVSVTSESGNGGGAMLKIVDTGPGIPAAEREHVFDRFYRMPGTAEPGSGLGLSIVRAIVRDHDARVGLRDGPGGRGLEVRVTFPPSAP